MQENFILQSKSSRNHKVHFVQSWGHGLIGWFQIIRGFILVKHGFLEKLWNYLYLEITVFEKDHAHARVRNLFCNHLEGFFNLLISPHLYLSFPECQLKLDCCCMSHNFFQSVTVGLGGKKQCLVETVLFSACVWCALLVTCSCAGQYLGMGWNDLNPTTQQQPECRLTYIHDVAKPTEAPTPTDTPPKTPNRLLMFILAGVLGALVLLAIGVVIYRQIPPGPGPGPGPGPRPGPRPGGPYERLPAVVMDEENQPENANRPDLVPGNTGSINSTRRQADELPARTGLPGPANPASAASNIPGSVRAVGDRSQTQTKGIIYGRPSSSAPAAANARLPTLLEQERQDSTQYSYDGRSHLESEHSPSHSTPGNEEGAQTVGHSPITPTECTDGHSCSS